MNTPEQIKKALQDAEWLKCGKGVHTTSSAYAYKKLSAILSTSGKEELIPMSIELCTVCGKIPPFLLKALPPDMPAELLPSAECMGQAEPAKTSDTEGIYAPITD